jgi:hypothetical protein
MFLKRGKKEVFRLLRFRHGKAAGRDWCIVRLHILQQNLLQFVPLRNLSATQKSTL